MDLHYSQTKKLTKGQKTSFTTLWIYTILKLLLVIELISDGFTTLWIYTILKHAILKHIRLAGFTTLWIYTILKLGSPI